MKKTGIIIFTVLVLLIISSCKNPFGEKIESKGSITFNFNYEIEGAVSKALKNNWNKENSRTAQPVLPVEIQYKVTGLKNNPTEPVYFTNTTENTYDLNFGTYSIDVEGYIKDSSDEFTVKAFKSDSPSGGKTITINNANPDGVIEFILTPAFDTNINGTVKLPIVMESEAEITKITAEWTEDGSSKSQIFPSSDFINDATTSTDSVTFTMEDSSTAETDGVKAGVYSVVFSFYKYSAGIELLSYRLTETINVFSNMKTDCWKKISESAAYMTDVDSDDSLEIYVTKALVTKFEQTVKYVDGINGSDGENSGSYFAPFKTIQYAVNVINQQNEDSNSSLNGEDFSIILKNNVTDDNANSYLETDNYALVNINPSANLNLTISSYDTEHPCVINAARSSTASGRVFYIGEKTSVKLMAIKITGGCYDSGSGIYNNGNLIIKNDVVVTDNFTEDGITQNNVYLPSGKILQIDSELSGCKIGVNVESLPSGAGIINSVPFTSGYSQTNTEIPSKYFYSDNGQKFNLALKPGEENLFEAALVLSGGSLNLNVPENVKFYLSQNVIPALESVKIFAEAECCEDFIYDENFQWVENKVTVSVLGADITSNVTITKADNGSLEFQVPANIPGGNVIQFVLVGKYKNIEYSSQIGLQVGISATETSITNYLDSISSGQTANLVISDKNPDLEVLKNAVLSSTKDIVLNLEVCTDLTIMPQDCFGISNPDNKLKKVYLPSTVTKYIDMNGNEQNVDSPEVGGENGETDLRYALLYAPVTGSNIDVVSDLNLKKTVPVMGNIKLLAENEDVTVLRDESNLANPIFEITDKQTELVIGGGDKKITFDGNCYDEEDESWANGGQGFLVMNGGTVTLKENCEIIDYKVAVNKGTIQVTNGTLNIEGAKISNLVKSGDNDKGLGIRVENSVLNFSAGEVSNSDAYYGAIWVNSGSVFNMSGTARVYKNSGRYGGGIFVEGGTFNMTGGIVEENRAWGNKSEDLWGGGGLYTERSATVVLSGGKFINNYTEGTSGYNTAMPGGAIHATSGTIKIYSTVEFIGNKTIRNGNQTLGNKTNTYYIDNGVNFYLDDVSVPDYDASNPDNIIGSERRLNNDVVLQY